MSTVPVPMAFPSASVIVIVASGSPVPVIGVVLGLKLDGIRTVGATGIVDSMTILGIASVLVLFALSLTEILHPETVLSMPVLGMI